MDIFSKCKSYTLATECREKGIYPYFHALESKQDTVVIMEGARRIMLGSNNYLGLTINQDVIDAAADAVRNLGTGCSGSRFLNGTLKMHLELEAELSSFLHKEGCVTFSTGFQSNLGIISSLVGLGDYVLLSMGKMLRYRHSDMADLEKKLKSIPEKAGILIVTDGVFSMSGDIAKLPEICDLAEKYGARVMVDDAHGLGVIGEGGRGTASHFGLEDKVDVIMGTFSKSLASLGGYMAASEVVCEYVRHNSRPFIFSASMTPATCAAALAALRHLEAHPELPKQLMAITEYARKGFISRGIPIKETDAPIIPIYTNSMENTLIKAKQLYDHGVFVNSVLPPAVAPNECMLRTSYMATLTEELIDEALDIFVEVFAN